MGTLEFRLLGPLEVRRGGVPVDLGPYKQRAVLAALAAASPQVVSVDALIDRLWRDAVPRSAGHALRVYVSNLRKLLDPDREAGSPSQVLVTHEPGYRLVPTDDGLDAIRFERLLAAANALADTDARRALAHLEEALGLWRGPALADFVHEPWAGPVASRLDGMRLTATELRFELALRLDRHREMVDEVEAVAWANPLRERLWGQLMLALYRCGRQADALRAFQRVRQHLAEELGLDPGPELRAIEAAVLAHDVSVGGAPGSTPAAKSTTDATRGAVARPADEVARTPGHSATDVPDEQRTATALFADLVGSTPLGEEVEPDEYKLVITGAIERMVAACEDLGGNVVKIAGDGVLALFGAPVAHEDDAERAVLAGLRIVDDIREYGDEVARAWGVEPLLARAGINTGPLVTGLTGGGHVVEYTALGDTVNTAARLESVTEPGTVLVADATKATLGPDFTWSEARTLTLKGKSTPVTACAATGGRPGGRRLRGLPGRATPLIGRDRELALAAAAVRDVHAGRGGALLIGGDAGLGKSRLLVELRQRALAEADPDRPVAWLEGHCISYGESHLLWPIREALHGWIGTLAGQPTMRVRIALRKAVEALVDPDGDPYPALAAVLGVDDAAAATLGGPDQRETAIRRAVRSVIVSLARDRPVVIAIDDLHWADAETLDLLEALAPVSEREAVLLLLVARPEPDHGSWRLREHLQRGPRTRLVDLVPLTGGTDEGLLDSLVGAETLPPALRAEILERAEGNPFYLEEIVRSLTTDGVLVPGSDGYRYVRRDAGVRLPETVEQVIVSRIDRLPPSCRDVLLAASAIGRQFSRDLLVELVDRPNELDEALMQLERLALVEEHRRWPERELRFLHALIQEAAHRTLVGRRRRDLHRRVALALSGAGQHVADAARHWELAGDDIAALDAYVAAGMAELGSATGSYYLAAAVMERALAIAERTGTPLAPLVEANALSVVAIRTVTGGDQSRRRPMFTRALAKARESGDLPTVARTLARLAIDEANDLELDAAHTHAEEAMRLANGADDEARLPALDCRKLVGLYLGELDVVRVTHAALDDLIEASDVAHGMFRYWVLAESSVVALACGETERALHQIDAALALERSSDENAELFAAFLAISARIRQAIGRYDEALAAAREAHGIISVRRHLWWERWIAAEYGSLLLELGAYPRAVHVLRPAVAVGRSPMASQEIRCAGMLALAGARAGDTGAEQVGADAFRTLVASMRLPDGKAYLYGADGQLSFAETLCFRGDLEGAWRIAAPIAAAADEAGWRDVAAHAHLVLGAVELTRADGVEAMRHFSRALTASGTYPGLRWRAVAGLAAAGSRERLGEASAIVSGLLDGCADDADGRSLAAAAADPLAGAGFAGPH